jgi:oligosaccharide repeat unit polymerase
MKMSQISGAIFWVGLYLFSAIALLFMLNAAVSLQSVIFLAVVVLVMWRCQSYGVLHPLSWFSLFFYLYTVSYPMYVVTVGGYYANLDFVIPISFLAYLSFSAAVLLLSPRTFDVPYISLNRHALAWMAWIGLVLCLLFVFYAISLGVESKRQFLDAIKLAGLEQVFIVFLFVTLLFAVRVAVQFQVNRNENAWSAIFDRLGVSVFLVFLAAFGVTGERDYVFRLVLLLVVVVFSYRYAYKYYYLLFAVFALVLILPFSQAAKGYFVSDSVAYAGYQEGDIFNTEFASAGRNIHYVIARGIDDYGGATFIGDVKRYFSFIYPEQQSTTAWFNDYIRNSFGEGGTSGWGFSLVAEGYVNFGWYGPAVLFFFLGVVTALVYRVARLKDYGFIFYLLYIPTLIYVLRADLSNLLSLAFKVNFALVLLMYLGNRLLTVRSSNV